MKSQHVLFGVFQTNYSNLVLDESLTKAEIAHAQALGELGNNVKSANEYQNIASLSSRGFNAAIDGTFLGTKLRYGATVTAAIAREQDPSTDYKKGGVLVQPETPLVVAAQLSGNARVSYELGGALPTDRARRSPRRDAATRATRSTAATPRRRSHRCSSSSVSRSAGRFR